MKTFPRTGYSTHAHVPEMTKALFRVGRDKRIADLYASPDSDDAWNSLDLLCAGKCKHGSLPGGGAVVLCGSAVVRVIEKPPHTKWATGSNLVYVSYAADAGRGTVIALGAIDNLGKGAAGQAVQNLRI